MSTHLYMTFPHLSIYLKNEQTLQLKAWAQVTMNEVKHEETLLVGGRGESATSLILQPHNCVSSLFVKPDPLVLCFSSLSLPLNLPWTSSSPCPTEEEMDTNMLLAEL